MFEFLCRKVKISHVGTVQKVKKVKKSARLLLYSINTLASQRVAQMRSFVPSCWDPPKQSKRRRNVVKTSATLVVAMTAASQRGGCPARQLRRCDEFAPSPNVVHVLARLQYGLGITSIWPILQNNYLFLHCICFSTQESSGWSHRTHSLPACINTGSKPTRTTPAPTSFTNFVVFQKNRSRDHMVPTFKVGLENLPDEVYHDSSAHLK